MKRVAGGPMLVVDLSGPIMQAILWIILPDSVKYRVEKKTFNKRQQL